MAFKFNKQGASGRIRRKDFNSEEGYLGAIYDANRIKIAEALPGFSKEQFIANVQANKDFAGGVSVSKALDILGRSVSFTPEAERFGDNVIKAIKSYGRFQQFREMMKDERGRYTRYDPTKLKYNRKDNSYIYDGRIRILFDESPKDIVLQELAQ